jgi:hypothetical protein
MAEGLIYVDKMDTFATSSEGIIIRMMTAEGTSSLWIPNCYSGTVCSHQPK